MKHVTGGEAPLDVLLSHAVLELTRGAEQLEPSLNIVMWADFLRVADGAARKSMHLDARVSKRVVTNAVALCTRAGWLTVDDDGAGRLTDQGLARRDSWGAAVDRACMDFESHHGPALREALTPLVASFDLELPHYLCPYGTPDPSITGGRPHGADWRPVRRDHDVDTTSDLSVMALLSQALTAYSMEYEQRAGPMVWGVYLARHRDAPLPFGGTFERHRFDARRARAAYGPTTTAIEASWRARYGDALRHALEAVEASLTGQHADHPEVIFKVGVGFHEASCQLRTSP